MEYPLTAIPENMVPVVVSTGTKYLPVDAIANSIDVEAWVKSRVQSLNAPSLINSPALVHEVSGLANTALQSVPSHWIYLTVGLFSWAFL